MANANDLKTISQGSAFGDSMNQTSGNWISTKFKTYQEIADFMNESKINLKIENITFANGRFFVLFLLDSIVKIKKRKGK